MAYLQFQIHDFFLELLISSFWSAYNLYLSKVYVLSANIMHHSRTTHSLHIISKYLAQHYPCDHGGWLRHHLQNVQIVHNCSDQLIR